MALTTSTTLTQEFVDILSAELLLEPDPQYIFGQFTKNVVEIGTQPGKTILIDRYPYLAGTFSAAARALTDGTAIDTSKPVGLTANQVTVNVKEYAGPYSNDDSKVVPLGVSEFLKKRAKHDVAAIVGQMLRRDKDATIDAIVRDLYLATTNVTTADGTAEGVITAGKKINTATIAEVLKELRSRNVPTFANGNYIWVIGPKDQADLLQDAGFREAVRYQTDRLFRGQLVDYLGFTFVFSNNMPTKAVGAGSAVTGYQSVAFGPDAVGQGVGMAPEVRKSNDDDFRRQDLVIWIMHAGFAALDARFAERVIST